MKKYVTILLSLVFVLSLVACGIKSTSNSDASSKTSQKEEMADKSDSFESKENDNDDYLTTSYRKDAIDKKECSIKITDVNPDGEMGCTLKVQLENKSDQTNHLYGIKDASVNGVTYHLFFAIQVKAGEKAEEEIYFDRQMLKNYGIKKCTNIELTFHVYDIDGPCEVPIVADTIHVYPYGIENATIFVNHVQPSDKLIIDNDYVVVSVKKCGLEDWGYIIKFYLMNKTSKPLIIDAEDVSINGIMVEPYFDPYVSPQKVAFGFMTWDNDTLRENKIDEVKEIKFKLRVRYTNNLLGENLVNEEITINP